MQWLLLAVPWFIVGLDLQHFALLQRHPTDHCCAATHRVISQSLEVWAHLHVFSPSLPFSEDLLTPISILKMCRQCFGGKWWSLVLLPLVERVGEAMDMQLSEQLLCSLTCQPPQPGQGSWGTQSPLAAPMLSEEVTPPGMVTRRLCPFQFESDLFPSESAELAGTV